MKERYGFFADDFDPVEGTPEEVNAISRQFRDEVSKKAVSLVCDRRKMLPLDREKIKHVTIVYSGHDKTGSGVGFDRMVGMKASFEKRGATVDLRRGLVDEDGKVKIKEIAEKSDLIVYAGFLMRYAPQGYNAFYDDEMRTFHHALTYGLEKSIGIGLGSPFMYFDYYFAFSTFINAYNTSDEMQEAAVAAMYGEIPFKGGEPFRLIPDNIRHYLDLLEQKTAAERNE